jgi:hypothetical protein
MLKGAVQRFFGILVLILIVWNRANSQNTDTSALRLMFYNVENFFDIFDDTLKDDNDFLPDGLMRWNKSRYTQKVNSVYKVITAAGEWDPPAIIGLCEVEKRKILEDLTTLTYLSKFNYGIIHEESPDSRGIDVCLIYRKELAELLCYRYLIPTDYNAETFATRSILYSKWLIKGDTIHLFLNHWPSRRGGVLAGEPKRERIAIMLRIKTDSILDIQKGEAKIIIAGDFNCTPADNEVSILTEDDTIRESSNKIVNLTADLSRKGSGTYRYQGTWEMIDQIMVSAGLLYSKKGICTGPDRLKIFKPEFLLVKDPKYPGYTPFSTYSGYRYQGGFSDHLPVIIDLFLRM